MSSKKIAAEQLALNNLTLTVSEETHNAVAKNRLTVGGAWQADSADVDSVDTRVSTEESTQASTESSLNTRVSIEESTQASTEASLNTRLDLEEKTTQVATVSLTSGESSVDITFGDVGMTPATWNSTPAVAGTVRCTDADAAIIVPMLAGAASDTGCKFVFSEEISGNNYKLDIIVTD